MKKLEESFLTGGLTEGGNVPLLCRYQWIVYLPVMRGPQTMQRKGLVTQWLHSVLTGAVIRGQVFLKPTCWSASNSAMPIIPEDLKGSVWFHNPQKWFLWGWVELFSQQRKVPEKAQWEMTASQLLPAYSSPAEFWVIDLHFQGRWCMWFGIKWQWPIVEPCKAGTYSLTFLFCMNCVLFPSNLPCSSWPLLKKLLFF